MDNNIIENLLKNMDEKQMTEALNKASEIINKTGKENVMDALSNVDISKLINSLNGKENQK